LSVPPGHSSPATGFLVDAAPSPGTLRPESGTDGVNETLTILAGSAVAVTLMVAIAAWARIARPTPPLDETAARALLAGEFPDHHPGEIWLAADGAGAVARAGGEALILFRLGDAWVARGLPWERALAAPVQRGRVHFRIGDPAAPWARLAVSGITPWPPEGHPEDHPEERKEPLAA